MKIKKIICPICHNDMKIYLDEYGYTPWHLRCNNCHINIGITHINKIFDFLNLIQYPNTYSEYYNNAIQLWIANGIVKINKEINND